MADNTTDTGTGIPTDARQDAGGDAAPEAQQGHHSQRQPRDDAKRFAKDGKPPEAPAAPQRFKRVVKRYGKEMEEEATLEDLWRERDERERLLARDKASTERFQRSSQLAKDAETAKQVAEAVAKKNYSRLRGYFEQNKLNPKEALADLLEAAIQDESMTPEQRELVQLRAEKEARAEQERRQAEDAEVEAFYKEVDELRPEVEQVWQHALTSTGLPKTAKMMEVTARIFLEAAEAGTKLSPEQVAEYARWELVEVNGVLVNELDPAQFIKHFAPLAKKINESMTAEDFEKNFPDLAKRYHRMLVAKLRGGGAPSTRGAPQQGGARQPARPKASGEKGGGVLGDPFLEGILDR